MRSRLLQSFLFVLGFWWFGAALFWSSADPRVNLRSLERVLALFPWLSVQLPTHVTVLNAWTIQKTVLASWSLPLLIVTGLVALTGIGGAWAFAWRQHRQRGDRVRRSDGYRGISVSRGVLPVPHVPAVHALTLRSRDARLSKLTETQLAVLTDVLGLLAAQPDAFAGQDREPGSLLTHTLRATYAALADPHQPGLAAIVAAASELGKLTAWRKGEDGLAIRIRSEPRESARLLAALPSWWALPESERLAVLLAVKYYGRAEQMPEVGKDRTLHRLARGLLDRHAERVPPPEGTPSTRVYEKREPRVVLLETFERELAMIPFQTPGLPKNTLAAGWKVGSRVYMLDYRLNECLLPKLPPEIKETLTPAGEKARLEPLIAALAKLFHEMGWLVLEEGDQRVSPDAPLWVIQAGKNTFRRVIIVDLPPPFLARLPSRDTHYEITVLHPLFQIALGTAISKDDLMGGMLRPKTSSTPPVDKSAEGKPMEARNSTGAAGGPGPPTGPSVLTGLSRKP
jgi:hypothetical protein